LSATKIRGPAYTDPRGGIETCGIVELMHSFEMLTKITGQPVWADRCEEIAFNSFPAALTADEKALHYVTCANQIQLDRDNKSPEIQNGGTMVSYSPFEVYRCCQHNVSHGWPYYAEELWLATPDNGLCASLYAACEVSAKAGDAAAVKITEETDYPFRDTSNSRLRPPGRRSFPLYLASAALVRFRGGQHQRKGGRRNNQAAGRSSGLSGSGGRRHVTLRMPMKLAVRRWPKNQDAASVDYGPLSFSLAIKERFASYGTRNPKLAGVGSVSRLALELRFGPGRAKSASSFKLIQADGPLAAQPFTPETAPIKLEATGRRIPQLAGRRQQCHRQAPAQPGEIGPTG
jgi:DUF1680 family protein